MVQKIDVAVISGGISSGEKRVSQTLLAKDHAPSPIYVIGRRISGLCLRRQTRACKHSINSITISNIDS